MIPGESCDQGQAKAMLQHWLPGMENRACYMWKRRNVETVFEEWTHLTPSGWKNRPLDWMESMRVKILCPCHGKGQDRNPWEAIWGLYKTPGYGVEQCRESSGWCKINFHWFEVCDTLVPTSMQHTDLHSTFQVWSTLLLFIFQQCYDTGKSTKWFTTNIFSQNLYDQQGFEKIIMYQD